MATRASSDHDEFPCFGHSDAECSTSNASFTLDSIFVVELFASSFNVDVDVQSFCECAVIIDIAELLWVEFQGWSVHSLNLIDGFGWNRFTLFSWWCFCNTLGWNGFLSGSALGSEILTE